MHLFPHVGGYVCFGVEELYRERIHHPLKIAYVDWKKKNKQPPPPPSTSASKAHEDFILILSA